MASKGCTRLSSRRWTSRRLRLAPPRATTSGEDAPSARPSTSRRLRRPREAAARSGARSTATHSPADASRRGQHPPAGGRMLAHPAASPPSQSSASVLCRLPSHSAATRQKATIHYASHSCAMPCSGVGSVCTTSQAWHISRFSSHAIACAGLSSQQSTVQLQLMHNSQQIAICLGFASGPVPLSPQYGMCSLLWTSPRRSHCTLQRAGARRHACTRPHRDISVSHHVGQAPRVQAPSTCARHQTLGQAPDH